MRKFKLVFLSALMVTGLMTFTACGMGNNNNTNEGTDAPYEDDVNNNGNNNGTNNGNNNGNGNNIGDDIQNGVDNIGDDIQNGIDNMQDGTQNNGGDMDNRSHRTSRLEEAGHNFIDSVREASDAIKDGIMQLNGMK